MGFVTQDLRFTFAIVAAGSIGVCAVRQLVSSSLLDIRLSHENVHHDMMSHKAFLAMNRDARLTYWADLFPQVVVPPWPMFNKHPVQWLPKVEDKKKQ